MFTNYLKIAWRNLVKNRGYTAINITGLAVGLAVAMLIGLWIRFEYSFGREHANMDQIYNVVTNGIDSKSGFKYTTQATPLPLYVACKDQIPEVKYSAIVNWGGNNGLMVKDKKLIRNGTEVSKDFFKIFRFKFLQGDPNTALNDPEAIVLTKGTAQDLFGHQDVVGQYVKWNNADELKITGIIEDISNDTYFGERDYFMAYQHFENQEPWVQYAKNDWGSYSCITYVELMAGAGKDQVLPKIRNLIQTNYKETKNEVGLYPMSQWRLYNEFDNWEASAGRIVYVRMFGIIGMLVLLLACINFMNLSTAQSIKKAKEIGVRKAIGSLRHQLIGQFLVEAVFMSSIAMVVSILILMILLPAFNTILQVGVSIPVQSPGFWMVVILVVLGTGLMAGSYPSFYLSSISSIKALKGKFISPGTAISPRRVLVVVQFVASIGLIISTLTIYKQIQYTKSRPTGYNGAGVLVVDMKEDLIKNYEVLKNELLSTGIVESVTKSSSPVYTTHSNSVIEQYPGSVGDDKVSIVNIAVSPDYFKTLGMQLLEGRDFNAFSFDADSDKVIINLAAKELMQLKDPLGNILTEKGGRRREVIGVVENSIMENPYEKVRAARFICDPNWAGYIMFRIKDQVSFSKVESSIASIFDKYNPAFPFEYKFVDQEYGKKFALEVTVGKLASILAILAIFISCLGLFGLSSFVAEQRKKEIGVRKVIGASVFNLWQLLSKEFVVLVGISSLLAAPIAYYFMNEWLQKYSYRTEMSWWIFVAASIGALLITLLTVSFQALKAASANPIQSLKSE
ncbi:MAG: ABC transporter permease [Saprospiraceae bacterium]|nr:ABC transporter permease [Saprospiraceae bacterium]MBK7437358.1 ABC transporter permease [Saprospiraceae bacterium]MBK8283355.1 ABC transporter permease [Saprospiraceae bacterium]